MDITVNADGTVTLNIDGNFTAQQLGDVLQQIGEARAQVAKDRASPIGLKPDHIVVPGWYTEAMPDGHSLLALSHPFYGWLWFALTPHDRCMLSHYLIRQQANAIAPNNPSGAPGLDLSPSNGSGGTIH